MFAAQPANHGVVSVVACWSANISIQNHGRIFQSTDLSETQHYPTAVILQPIRNTTGLLDLATNMMLFFTIKNKRDTNMMLISVKYAALFLVRYTHAYDVFLVL
jgi:hypothetical protein